MMFPRFSIVLLHSLFLYFHSTAMNNAVKLTVGKLAVGRDDATWSDA